MTDAEVFADIQHAYADARMTPEMARVSRLDRERLVGVERYGEKGQDAFVGMVFRQDNGTLLSIRLFEDCTYQTSGDIPLSDLRTWAYPLARPRF
ncbi:hypothetical protein GTZ99_04310 [Novosphingobium sp. FSY-8]|uniref:Uncharacterized protein n=1 Tax=Novosphingobium ovatum TaxID=1908523 RepID=A0ABW9XB87_9SPHN|nr:hypothetical protein [Novosphingobium ovatum]NBC35777.1 hypothetical protein [Novosphingobium ovatum]